MRTLNFISNVNGLAFCVDESDKLNIKFLSSPNESTFFRNLTSENNQKAESGKVTGLAKEVSAKKGKVDIE